MKDERTETTLSNGITRRDIMKLAGTYGLTSTLLAAASLAGPVSLPGIAKAASATDERRYKNTPKVQLKYGGDGFDERQLLILRAGMLDFIRDIEERTDGAVRIEFFGSNQISTQTNGISKTQQGIIDMFAATTQNSASQAPFYNVLDFPYLFPTRASAYHFLYHPECAKWFREPLLKMHGVLFLFSPVELRSIYLGDKYRGKPLVNSLEELKGAKIRTSGSQLGGIGLSMLGLNPVPVAWEETTDALRQGLVDGQETYASAVAHGGMAPVTTQAIEVEYFSGICHTAISGKVFDKMPGELQDAMLESAYWTQTFCQTANEASRHNVVGASNYPEPGTSYDRFKILFKSFTREEKEEFEKMASPKHQPGPYAQWRERLNKWSGCDDIFQKIYDIAREIPYETQPDAVPQRRWWRS